jgi:general secretion pathway protein A
VTTTGHRDRIEGYEQFFGFNEAPFSLAPNPRFLFESASHAAALAQVAYALERREPLMVITGEIGTGKTLLCRTVLQRLERKTFMSVVNDPMLDRDDLLKHILQDFGVISKDRTRLTPTSRHDLTHALQEFLASLAPLQAHAVVVVDEAQHLQPDVLEQIRLLSNIDDERGTMLQIILVGQADLEQVLARPELRQIQQRVSRRVRLLPLSAEELAQYVEHRLAVARGDQTSSRVETTSVTFTPDAIQALSTLSQGVPRVVNILCDRALEAAAAQWLRTIDASLINATAAVLGLAAQPVPASMDPIMRTGSVEPVDELAPVMFGGETEPRASSGARTGLLVGASLMLAALVIWFGARALNQPAPEQPPSQSAPPPSATTAPAPAPAAPTPSTPAPATSTPPPAPPAVTTAAPTGERFEIIVASFRTESRAASVAAEVTALGLPIRRRIAAGWQQVLAGPFASRAQADEAQQRLAGAGLTGTQIVPSAR